MVGKSRSGLANDRRAYGCDRICATTPICSSLTTISLADIATFGVYGQFNNIEGWLLNGNTTLMVCDVLEIPAGQTLLPNGFTLTNNGTINVRGELRNTTEGFDAFNYISITINNGTINVFPTGSITVSVEIYGNAATFTNNGVLNNNGYIFCQTFGVINNTSGGRINNNSADVGGIGGFRLNSEGTFNNSGVFINNTGATSYNASGATIYNYGGGLITNNGDITNAGDIFTGNSICGFGTINGTGSFSGNITVVGCPP